VVRAVILVKAQMGQATNVAAALRKIKGVSDAYAVTGPYDAVAIAEAKDVADLGRFVVSKMQRVRGVGDTVTCLIVG